MYNPQSTTLRNFDNPQVPCPSSVRLLPSSTVMFSSSAFGTSPSVPQITAITPEHHASIRKLSTLLLGIIYLQRIDAGILTTPIEPLTFDDSNAPSRFDTSLTTDDVRRTVKTLYTSIYSSKLTLETVCASLFQAHSMLLLFF